MKKYFIIITIILTACNHGTLPSFYNKSFEEICDISNQLNVPFCVVLIDFSQNISHEYIELLQHTHNILHQKAIYNIANIDSIKNEFYLKWLAPISTPLTCIFSPNGKLIDLIPGASRESFLYIQRAIESLETTKFHFPNHFKKNKKQLIPLLNNLLEQANMLKQGIYIPNELDALSDSLYYPYPIYLKLTGELLNHDTIAAQNTAQDLLDMETPYFLDAYKKEYITAHQVLTPNFAVLDEPHISIDNDSFKFTNCSIGDSILFHVNIQNKGNKPVIISEIHLSCTCLQNIKNKEYTIIKTKDSLSIPFLFIPDVEGNITRDIFIISNAINLPILHINIFANIFSNHTNK